MSLFPMEMNFLYYIEIIGIGKGAAGWQRGATAVSDKIQPVLR